MKDYRLLRPQIQDWKLENKRLFLRADFNIPLDLEGAIIDDFRLERTLPTIKYLIDRNAQVIIGTHIGNPKDYDQRYSTRHLIPWFNKHKIKVKFIENPQLFAAESANDCILLENLRFFSGEQNHDPIFAHHLAQWGDFYITDAFGVLHKTDTSVIQVPELFENNKKSIGFLVEEEIQALDILRDSPPRPFVCIIGGAKARTKLPMIKILAQYADYILLCPALAFTVMAAHNIPVGQSVTDQSVITDALELTKLKNVILPVDYQIAFNKNYHIIKTVKADQMPKDAFGISIGPETINIFTSIIATAQSIFFNGMMGFLEYPETLHATNSILNAIARSPGYAVVGGGDTVAAVHVLNKTYGIDFLSTGGGATMCYIARQSLPGLDVLMR